MAQLTLFDGFVDIAAPEILVRKKPTDRKKINPVKKSKLAAFIEKNNGRVIEDAITVQSEDFKSYCKALRTALRADAKEKGWDNVSLKPGHYDMYGFFEKNGQYIYWSFTIRRQLNTYLDKPNSMQGFLYRTAENERDFRGGINHYTDLEHLSADAMKLLEQKSLRSKVA